MQEMTMQEMDEVSGALGPKDLVWVADQITDFVRGFSAGWDAGAQK
ncbi:hypothetical protein [Massilia sp. 9096]|nr:hypothetical protein [Massilia sp. 9096]